MHISAVWQAVNQDRPLAVSEIPVEPEEYVHYWLPPFPEVPRSVEEPDPGAVPNQVKVEEAPAPSIAPSYVTRFGRTSQPPPHLANFVNYTKLMANISI